LAATGWKGATRIVAPRCIKRDLFSRVKWLEGLRRLRLTEGHISDLVACSADFEMAEALVLDPIICLELFG
jgi:hypothetical protein